MSKKLLRFSLVLSFLTLFFFIKNSNSEIKPQNNQELKLTNELKEIATEVNQLKEKVYRSKAKLKLLEETLLLGKITGSKAVVRFSNAAGGLFKITGGEYYLNGKLIHKLGPKHQQEKQIVIFDGETPPGTNKINLKLTFTGADDGVLKMFTYLKDYKFDLESTYEFPVYYGKTTSINIESIDRGPLKNTLEERLSIRYKTMTEENTAIPF